MENVIAFPSRKPAQGEMMTVSLEDMFSVLTNRKSLSDLAWERRHEERLNELRPFSVADLRRFWDGLGEDSFYTGPEGLFDCSDIHTVLNEKGDGEYCAV